MSSERNLQELFHETFKDIYLADALSKLAENEVNQHAEAA
jgi:ferritin-like metal-binding protein YciE